MTKSIITLLLLVAGVLATKSAAKITYQRCDGRIVGGSYANDGQYPHMISIQQIEDGHVCGGAIISREWIVTAAHCLDDETTQTLSVLAGTNNITGGGTKYTIKEMYQHDKYKKGVVEYDVALLKVNRITYTKKVKAIVLDTAVIGNNARLTISGWGCAGVDYPDNLKHLTVTTVASTSCDEKEICAQGAKDEGACFADSGSPLIINNNGVVKQVGIASWVEEPCGKDPPDGYSRISYFRQWFKDKCKCIT